MPTKLHITPFGDQNFGLFRGICHVDGLEMLQSINFTYFKLFRTRERRTLKIVKLIKCICFSSKHIFTSDEKFIHLKNGIYFDSKGHISHHIGICHFKVNIAIPIGSLDWHSICAYCLMFGVRTVTIHFQTAKHVENSGQSSYSGVKNYRNTTQNIFTPIEKHT